MLGSIGRRIAFAAAAVLASCTGIAPATAAQTRIAHAPAESGTPRGLFNSWPISSPARYGRKGAGISMAQQQRAAAKKRCIARNRRHYR
ncbi:hypothetical protein [Massilia sp. Leaf139]|uniref:hypothetical protein n=1 Tax=Massilia sp. Leaf139 TaxID=1736272 RepID=UPI0006FE89AC|nr:hypothetical protein [Massilia sp. Leaf139]KQQ94982.1 hypothetical protein ASF77_22295 [Massilia sp. Leaf139]